MERIVIGRVGTGISDPGYSCFVLLDHFLCVHQLRRNGESKFEHGFFSGGGGFLRKKSIVAFFSIAIVPLSGETPPRRSANKVDLPAPLGPTNPIRSPRLTWSETSSKSAPPAKDFES